MTTNQMEASLGCGHRKYNVFRSERVLQSKTNSHFQCLSQQIGFWEWFHTVCEGNVMRTELLDVELQATGELTYSFIQVSKFSICI